MGIVSRFLTAVKEAASLGLGGEGLPRPARLVYVLLTALGTILVTAGVLLLRKYLTAVVFQIKTLELPTKLRL